MVSLLEGLSVLIWKSIFDACIFIAILIYFSFGCYFFKISRCVWGLGSMFDSTRRRKSISFRENFSHSIFTYFWAGGSLCLPHFLICVLEHIVFFQVQTRLFICVYYCLFIIVFFSIVSVSSELYFFIFVILWIYIRFSLFISICITVYSDIHRYGLQHNKGKSVYSKAANFIIHI